MSINEIYNGVTAVDQLITFGIAESGLVVVSNQNNDATTFSLVLCALRNTQGVAATDYVELKPDIPFDNSNNYQALTAGSYAVKVVTAADIIVAIHE